MFPYLQPSERKAIYLSYYKFLQMIPQYCSSDIARVILSKINGT